MKWICLLLFWINLNFSIAIKTFVCTVKKENSNVYRCSVTSKTIEIGDKITIIADHRTTSNADIKKFDFTHSVIPEIPNQIFSTFESLEILELERQSVKSLSIDTFLNASKLKYLNLQHNLIEILEEGTFLGAENLEEILLGRNKINWIDKNTFQKLKKLKILNLNDNLIKNLDADLFSSNANLRELRIPRNQIESLPETLFKQNSILKIINFRENRIKSLTATMFNQLSNLGELWMEENICVNKNFFEIDFKIIERELLPCLSVLVFREHQQLKSQFDNLKGKIEVLDSSLNEIKKILQNRSSS